MVHALRGGFGRGGRGASPRLGEVGWVLAEALPGAGAGHSEEVGDLGPGAALGSGLGHQVGQAFAGLGVKAGQKMQGDGGVGRAGPVAQGGQVGDRAVEGLAGVGPGGGGEIVVPVGFGHDVWVSIQLLTVGMIAGAAIRAARRWAPAQVAVFEAVAVAFEGDDFGVVDEAVDHGGGDGGVAEDLAPAAERLVGGDDDARLARSGLETSWKNRLAASASKGM